MHNINDLNMQVSSPNQKNNMINGIKRIRERSGGTVNQSIYNNINMSQTPVNMRQSGNQQYLNQLQEQNLQHIYSGTHVRTENSPMQKHNLNQKQLRNKQLINSEERIKQIPNVGHHQKVLTATFNKEYIDKVTKDNQKLGGAIQDMMAPKG